MELEELLEYLSEGKTLTAGTEAFDCMHRWSLETQRLTQELNTGVHDMEEIREYMCRITGRTIDESFRMFLPFYTDFGKNIRIGRNVFINACCCFQDQGGISIGNGTLIGASANVVMSDISRKNGHVITFAHFFKVGFPTMLATVAVSAIYLIVRFPPM